MTTVAGGDDEARRREQQKLSEALTNSFLASLKKATAGELRKDVPKSTSEDALVAASEDADAPDVVAARREAASRADTLRNEILEAERDRLKQQREHRHAFFIWAVIAISAVLVFGGIMFAWHVAASDGKPSEPVMISWMTTSIVEVIGLGYIIARSLFEVRNGSPAVSNADRKAVGS